jgi:hypothetical protein
MLLRCLLSAFTLGTAMSFGAAAADVPKEGSVAFTGLYHVTAFHSVSMGKDLTQYGYEVIGGTIAGKEGTFPDRMSARCVGGARTVKGTIENETGMCEYLDVSGTKYSPHIPLK